MAQELYHGELTDKIVFGQEKLEGQERDYWLHRIPGIVVTKKDTVIIYCEARTKTVNHRYPEAWGDWYLMDIYLRRSTDGGDTFGEPIYVARGSLDEDGYACMNNPEMIVGQDNTLHLLYCKDYSIGGGGIWYKYSTDDGLTWSEERCLDEFTRTLGFEYNAFAFGPTHGICTRDGVLVCPVWVVERKEGRDPILHYPASVHLFFSADNGKTWKISDKIFNCGCGETAIAELSDGAILINGRTGAKNRVQNVCRRFDKEAVVQRWEGEQYVRELIDPSCCAGIVAVDIEGLPYSILFCGCESTTTRENVRVKISTDDGKRYLKSVNLSGEGKGGYCDVAVDSKGKVYAIWEEKCGTLDHLTTFSLADAFFGK